MQQGPTAGSNGAEDGGTKDHARRDAAVPAAKPDAEPEGTSASAECLQRLLSLPAQAKCLERCEDLDLLRDDLDGVFALGADLDCSEQTATGSGFLPIG